MNRSISQDLLKFVALEKNFCLGNNYLVFICCFLSHLQNTLYNDFIR